jgi:serine/threonine protein phosphatase PrpC
MKLQSYGLSDVGRAREHNEDALAMDEALGLFIVADGVGGAAAGEVASQMVCQTIRDCVAGERELLKRAVANPSPANRGMVTTLLKKAVHAACGAVYRAAQNDPDRAGMASTVAMVQLIGGGAIVVHAGDSRVYLHREGKLHQLTDDHTMIGEMVRRGEMTAEEAEHSSLRSVLTRAVGFQPHVEIDALHVELAANDRLLLCSDGLFGHVKPHEIEKAAAELAGPTLLQALIDEANRRGGSDNITVVVVEIEEVPIAQPVHPTAKLDALKQLHLFKHLTYKELNAVLSIAQVRTYKPGRTIIMEGDDDTALYISVTGKVKVIKQGQTLATLEAGSSFGEMALVDCQPRSADVVADDLTRVLVIEREAFLGLLKHEPSLSVKMLWAFCQVTSTRLRETSAELSWLKNTGSGESIW